MATFAEIMASQPKVYQNATLATLVASGQTLGAGWSLYQTVSNLSGSFEGSAARVQASEAGALAARGQQVLTALTTTQNTINAGSQQMTAAKARLNAVVNAARAEQFVVTPVGQVVLGTWHYAKIAACSTTGASAALKAQLGVSI